MFPFSRSSKHQKAIGLDKGNIDQSALADLANLVG